MPLSDGLRAIGEGLLPFATVAAAFMFGRLFQQVNTMRGEIGKLRRTTVDTSNDVAKILGHLGIAPSARSSGTEPD
jgi:hypothetical protein